MIKNKGFILIQNKCVDILNDFNNIMLNDIFTKQTEFFNNIGRLDYREDDFFNNHFNECLHYYGKYFNIILQKRAHSFYYDNLTNILISGIDRFIINQPEHINKNNIFIIKGIEPKNAFTLDFNNLFKLLTDNEIQLFRQKIVSIDHRIVPILPKNIFPEN